MADAFATYADTVSAPARKAFAVTPSDATDFVDTGAVPKALYVGVTGDVAVLLVDDAVAVTFVGVPAGALLPVRARKVLSTGTTATSIVGMA